MTALVGSDDTSLKGDLKAFGGDKWTIGIAPGAIIVEQLHCDCLGINDDHVLSQNSVT